MYLKRLELHGFKTFAERTELEFGPGITAIVGPNGSGKSNISDSILWVLGEQALKTLRSAKSTDVIFNGSDSRKAVGYAEVHLTLDNSSGQLNFTGQKGIAGPLGAYSEVTITRRVFRSGDSEFLINRVPVRLRDIQDLFLDTGMGRGSYSIISQGEVDAVLSSRAEERRAIFEEAAGIARYRSRKKDAVRKLEQVTQNLLRVHDVIGELEAQVGPLAEQCAAAREYQDLHGERTTLQLSLLSAQYQGLQTTVTKAREREDEARKELETLRAQVLQAETKEAAQRMELLRMEGELEEQRGVESRLSSAVLTAEGAQALLTQQMATEVAEAERLTEERAELLRQSASHVDEVTKIEEAIRAQEGAIKEQEAAIAEAEVAVGGAAEEMAARDIALQASRDAYMDLLDRTSRVRNNLAAVESLLRTSGGRTERIAAEQAEVTAKQQEAQTGLTLARSAVKEKQAARDEVVKARKAAAAARGAALERAADLRMQENTAREELAGLRARQRTLKELEESHEGYYPGVRAVLAGVKAGRLPGWYAPVSELMEVPAGLEIALEVALGADLQDIACGTEAEARRGVDFLKQTGSGRATFLALDLLAPAPRASVPKAPGVLGLAMDLVSFDTRNAPIAQHLLGRIIVVEDLDAALALSRSGTAKGWKSIVTREGELVTPARAITGGSPGKGAGLLSRRRELQDLTARIEALERTANGLRFKTGEATADVARLEAEQNELGKADEAAVAAIGAAEQKAAALTHEVTSCAERLTALAEEAKWISGEVTGAQEEAARHNVTLDGLEKAQKEAETAMAAAEAALTGGRSARDAASENLSALRVKLSETRGVLYSQQAALRRTLETRDGAARKQQALEKALAEVKGRQATLLTQQAEAEAEVVRLRAAFMHRAGELESAKAERAGLLEQISATLEMQRTAREGAEACQERVHRANLRVAQGETELQYLENQLFEDYRMTPDQAIAHAVPVENRSVAIARLKELQAAEESLGTINLGAIEEYDRIRERLDFLTTQRADLEQSRSDLAVGIVEIEKTCREKFIAAFTAIKREFQDLFVRLFGGGTTSLTLENPNDVLESGIEVHVTIPGKKNQHLLQLSGGERALTALALLFAMLRVKPSPFVVLDEIDAPLDEANVGRYCDVLRDFTRDTQFLIITHNKGTMEAADVLYGVTMEKAGVSKIVSVRLTEAAV